MRTLVSLLAITSLAALGCASDSATGSYSNAVTGVDCRPDPESYTPHDPDAPPTVDCSTPHDDVPQPGEPCCEFPQPGCDKDGCCDDDVIVEPEPPPPEPPEVI